MSNSALHPVQPDQPHRVRALDPFRSILVQAPAGSGKTDLLTRRFLRLLAEVESPGQIVAMTFSRAAAAEMRHRIMERIEEAANPESAAAPDREMAVLASAAFARSRTLNWNLTDLPAQLRIYTIDSFCRELALQQPLATGLGGGLDIAALPNQIYRRAARQALQQVDGADPSLSEAIATLLDWRDNNWLEMERLLVEMLEHRDRWMHGFVLEREPDWESLRVRLERPFANAARASLNRLSQLLDQVPNAREELLELARFACEEPGVNLPWQLAECVEIPAGPFADAVESAKDVFTSAAGFLQTQKGAWKSSKGLKTADGFPSTPRGRAGKARFATLIGVLAAIPGLESALASVRDLPPARYTEDEWQIVRACFI
ncbi:MAG: UvrD-helicase domain-containing protein, partial [Bryobacteraceae bacterium]